MNEHDRFQEQYIRAISIIGERAYCWRRNANQYEVGERVPVSGSTHLGYDIWGTGYSWEDAFAQVEKRAARRGTGTTKPKGTGKKMNILNVKDPRHDGFVVYVHPRQGFSLELSLPPDVGEGEDWRVEIFSDYFALASSGFKNGCRVFEFKQLYDLSDWAAVSSVQLAELLINWRGAKRDGYGMRNLYVVLRGKKQEQRDTLTVINPVCTKVRIAPHQLLEVVIFDYDGKERGYIDLIDLCIDPDKPYLEIEKIATKQVAFALENGQFRDLNGDQYLLNRHPFSVPVNPKIEDGSPIYPLRKPPKGAYRATHFFYRMSRHCIGDIQRLANGAYKSSEVTFHDDMDSIQAEFSLDVLIGVKGAMKPKLKAYGLSRRQQLLIQENTLADGSNIGKKVLAKEHVFEKNRLLLNPGDHDNVEFATGDDNCLTIEIAPPHYFNQKCSKEAVWEVQADPVWQFRHRHLPQTRLSTSALDKRTCLWENIQRFMVTPTSEELVAGPKHTFLGIVKLIVKGFKDMTRCVSFYMVAGKNKYSGGRSYVHKGASYTPSLPPVPMRVIVRFEESRTDDLLVTGAKSEKFSEIKIEDGNSNNTGKKKKKTTTSDVRVSER